MRLPSRIASVDIYYCEYSPNFTTMMSLDKAHLRSRLASKRPGGAVASPDRGRFAASLICHAAPSISRLQRTTSLSVACFTTPTVLSKAAACWCNSKQTRATGHPVMASHRSLLPASSHVLSNGDLLYGILTFLSLDFDRQDRHVAKCASVCRAFHEPAVRVLWRHMSTL